MKKQKLWIDIEYKLENHQVLTKSLITEYINKFYKNIVSKLDSSVDQYILFIFRIILENGSIKTVTKIQKLNLDDANKEALIEFVNDKINLVQESYFTEPIKSIIISYGVRKGKLEQPLIELNKSDSEKSHHVFYNNKLPLSLNPEGYGEILNQDDQTYLIALKKNIQILLKVIEGNHHIKFFKNSKLMYEWVDKINLIENSLIRDIGKTSIYWKDGNII